MTAGAILGLVLLNLWLLLVGLGVLFGLRGWTSWLDAARLAGLAYMLGLAASSLVWVWQLVVGIDLAVWSILVGGAVLATGACLVGLARGHRFPPVSRPVALPAPSIVAAV